MASDRYGGVGAGLRCRSADYGLVLVQRQPAEQVCAPLFCVSWFGSLQVLHIRCSHLCCLVSWSGRVAAFLPDGGLEFFLLQLHQAVQPAGQAFKILVIKDKIHVIRLDMFTECRKNGHLVFLPLQPIGIHPIEMPEKIGRAHV